MAMMPILDSVKCVSFYVHFYFIRKRAVCWIKFMYRIERYAVVVLSLGCGEIKKLVP
jgi:hypothetical protein